MNIDVQIIWQVLKWVYVLAFGLYGVFALLVWRQVHLMIRTLKGVLVLPLKIMGGGMVVVALVGLVLAIVIL